MKTAVYQSYRTSNVAPWVERCLASVRAWAAVQGYDYHFVDDRLFDYAGEDYCRRVRQSMQAIANVARLELIREGLAAGYDRAIWVDADVIVFDADRLAIDVTSGYAFCYEVSVYIHPDGTFGEHRTVNNCVCAFTREAPDLDILIALIRHIVAHRQIESNYTVGTHLLRALQPILGFKLLTNVGMFSPWIVQGLAAGDPRHVAIQARQSGRPIYAANLCTSLAARTPEADFMRAIDALVSSRGEAINRFLDPGGSGDAATPLTWEAEVGTRVAEMARLQADLVLQIEEGKRLTTRLGALAAKNEDFRAQFEAMRSSTSWRLTALLRAVGRRLKALRLV